MGDVVAIENVISEVEGDCKEVREVVRKGGEGDGDWEVGNSVLLTQVTAQQLSRGVLVTLI